MTTDITSTAVVSSKSKAAEASLPPASSCEPVKPA